MIVELAIATNIAPSHWAGEDDATIATALTCSLSRRKGCDVAGKAQLTIDVTATTAGAVADLDKAKAAVRDYGDAADTATKQSKDVSGAIDSVGGVAGGATTGLRDMSDAIAMAGFPELAAGMGVTATALESVGRRRHPVRRRPGRTCRKRSCSSTGS